MIAVVCVDDRNGLLFHERRQSRDRCLRADLLCLTQGHRLWMNAYSASQFTEVASLSVCEDFLSRAGAGEYCFVEDDVLKPFADRLEGLVVYHWNRLYPADVYLTTSPAELRLTLQSRMDFPGSSHETITRAFYVREADE